MNKTGDELYGIARSYKDSRVNWRKMLDVRYSSLSAYEKFEPPRWSLLHLVCERNSSDSRARWTHSVFLAQYVQLCKFCRIDWGRMGTFYRDFVEWLEEWQKGGDLIILGYHLSVMGTVQEVKHPCTVWALCPRRLTKYVI
jgi:hypothetical protein